MLIVQWPSLGDLCRLGRRLLWLSGIHNTSGKILFLLACGASRCVCVDVDPESANEKL